MTAARASVGAQELEPGPVASIALDEASCARAAQYSEARAGRALLVLREGEIVFERYADGWTADTPHPLASGTKSFSGVLAVCALADGILDDLDTPATKWIAEWRTSDDERRATITVRHLLELSSGLAPEHDSFGPRGYGIENLGPLNELATRLRRRQEPPGDRFAAALRVPLVAEPGERFDYGPTHFYAFGALLERALAAHAPDAPQTAFAYLRERVLLPAGIDIPLERFGPDAAGKPGLPGSGHLTAREWALFGEWVRLGGAKRAADGTLVRSLPEGALAKCFAPSATNGQYGLTWWLLNGEPGAGADVADGMGALARAGQTERIFDARGEPLDIVMAAGAGKQRLYLVPAHGLVVVRFAEQRPAGRDYDDAVFLRTLLGLRPQSATGER